jgi:hypothetical protein
MFASRTAGTAAAGGASRVSAWRTEVGTVAPSGSSSEHNAVRRRRSGVHRPPPRLRWEQGQSRTRENRQKRERVGFEQPNLPLKLVVRRHRAQG